MSTHNPRESPQYPSAGSQPTGPEQQPVYGGQQGYAGGPEGHGYQQPGPGGYQQPGYHQAGPYGYQQNMQRFGTQPGARVGFGEAIKRFYSKYAQFSGRASRSEFWWVALFMFVVLAPISLLTATVGSDVYGEPNGFGILLALILVVFLLGSLVPNIAIAIRRLHDANFSGWLYLLNFIPYIGGLIMIVFYVLPSKPEGARFDR